MANRSDFVSLVIRTFNEEKWIRHSLEMVFSQERVDFEVVIVDNGSSDKTVKIAEGFPVSRILTIEKYAPGAALNLGIQGAKGDYLAFLSAHCVPTSTCWLSTLIAGFEEQRVAGVYGRQKPMEFTDPADRSDLMMAFGAERRLQKIDWFFHNANSMIRRDVWSENPFDEDVSNIEDRLWARSVIERGYSVLYEPRAEVLHHNGLHRTADARRLRKQVEVIERVAGKADHKMITSLSPENASVVAIIPISERNRQQPEFSERLEVVLEELRGQKSIVQNVLLVGEGVGGGENVLCFSRESLGVSDDDSLGTVLQSSVNFFEASEPIPDFYLYLNWDYHGRPKNFLLRLLTLARSGGFDTVFGAEPDFGNYWVLDSDSEELREVDASLMPRESRRPLYRAFYGLGTLTSASILRTGKLVGGRVGIFELRGLEHPYRVSKGLESVAQR